MANALPSNAAPMLDLLAEVARTPSFPAGEVELTKGNALQGLKASEAQPGFRVERALNKVIYGNHPYATTTPTVESITSVNDAYFKTEHAKRFRPDRALLVITGRITPDAAMKMANAAFGNWKAEGAALADTPAAQTSVTPVRQVLTRDGSVQSTVRLASTGVPASTADLVPLRLTSTILGGGFQQPREHQSARRKRLHLRRQRRCAHLPQRRRHRRRRGRAQ
ncbi:insulinase family protein [Massilia sp. H-1]|nr:insulinase family protein [Massilia sp. H-1]